jgi:hypothetical protein
VLAVTYREGPPQEKTGYQLTHVAQSQQHQRLLQTACGRGKAVERRVHKFQPRGGETNVPRDQPSDLLELGLVGAHLLQQLRENRGARRNADLLDDALGFVARNYRWIGCALTLI